MFPVFTMLCVLPYMLLCVLPDVMQPGQLSAAAVSSSSRSCALEARLGALL